MIKESNDLVEYGDGEPTQVVPPKSTLAFERREVRRLVGELERLGRREHASETNAKLIDINERSLANLIVTGSSSGYLGMNLKDNKVRLVAGLALGMSRYAKDHLLAVDPLNDLSKSDIEVIAVASKLGGVNVDEARDIPKHMIRHLRTLSVYRV